MAKFEINKNALAGVVNSATAVRVHEVQALLDAVNSEATGKDVDAVKALLKTRWKARFERDLTDPHLSA